MLFGTLFEWVYTGGEPFVHPKKHSKKRSGTTPQHKSVTKSIPVPPGAAARSERSSGGRASLDNSAGVAVVWAAANPTCEDHSRCCGLLLLDP